MDGPGPIRRFLADDHDRLDLLLRSAVTPSGEVDLVSYRAFRAGLLRHIAIEEKILFPASQRARGGRPHPAVARLHQDHGALALLLVPTPTASIVEEIRSILDGHNEIEEAAEGVYDVCDRLLGDELEAVLERLRTYPPVKLAPHLDGPGIVRRAEDALRAVSRRRRSFE
jgi:hemerythrin HHE cation binding domain-containing protein